MWGQWKVADVLGTAQPLGLRVFGALAEFERDLIRERTWAGLSGTVPVAASPSDNVAVAAVQLLLDGQPLGAPLTTTPYGASWDTTKVANGTHQLGATATDPSGNAGTASPITVTMLNPAPPMTCFVVDVNVSVDGHGTVTTPTIHTAQAGELLLAFVASDGPATGPPGGDWLTMRPDGSGKLDVRGTFRTDDGALILVTYHGIALPQADGTFSVRTAPLFETGDARYAWLNTVQAVGFGVTGGAGGPEWVTYQVYALR